jgi:flavin reductase (DIM6/NTAB) family NADH-FMN oxidoreductase RutF
LTVSLAPPDALVSDFRHAMRRMAATVTLVSTSDAEGQGFGMVATSVTSVTMEPPTLLVCVSRTAHVHAPLMARGRMCVNVLQEDQAAVLQAFSGAVPHQERFAGGEWGTHPDLDVPYLPQSQALFFCDIEQVLEVGTHSVVLARVLEARAMESVRPMVYVDGRVGQLAAKGGA